MAIGTVRDGRCSVLAYPLRTVADAERGNLIYDIGSISKLFTATLLADLVRSGKANLDDPVNDYLPERGRIPPPHGNGITLLRLATHTSGLPRLPSNLRSSSSVRSNPYANYSADRLYEFLSTYRAVEVPGRYRYSNLGFGLLGHALSLRLGIPYEDAIRQRICAQLGMDDTLVSVSAGQLPRVAVGHSSDGKPVPSWDFQVLEGCGALHSTVADLSKLILASTGTVQTPLSDSIGMCLIPRSRTSKNGEIGLGWHLKELGGKRLAWHNGATAGFNGFLGFFPETRAGVCVLTNYGPPLLALLHVRTAFADRIGLRALANLVSV